MENWEGFLQAPGEDFLGEERDRQNNDTKRGRGSQAVRVFVLPAYPSIRLRRCPWRRNHPSPSTVREKMHSPSLFLGLFHFCFACAPAASPACCAHQPHRAYVFSCTLRPYLRGHVGKVRAENHPVRAELSPVFCRHTSELADIASRTLLIESNRFLRWRAKQYLVPGTSYLVLLIYRDVDNRRF